MNDRKYETIIKLFICLLFLLFFTRSITGAMSWMCSGKSNKELVENLCRSRLISSARVKQAMLRVDRANFLSGLQLRDNELKTVAYRDSPLGIGYDATISAPHMHAHVSIYSYYVYLFELLTLHLSDLFRARRNEKLILERRGLGKDENGFLIAVR